MVLHIWGQWDNIIYDVTGKYLNAYVDELLCWRVISVFIIVIQVISFGVNENNRL